MIFICLFEDDPDYAEVCEHILDQTSRGLFSGIVTPIAAAEILIKPLQRRQFSIADRYRAALRSLPNVFLAGLDAALSGRP